MIRNEYYDLGYTQNDLVNAFKINSNLDLSEIYCTDLGSYKQAVNETGMNLPMPKDWNGVWHEETIEEFHRRNQSSWNMPDEYKSFDVVGWIYSLCSTEKERDRVERELLQYNSYGLIDLLCWLKYMLDTFRKNEIVLGIGRGSSCASYVLYLMGIHRIDSLKYDIPLEEFFK